MEEYYNNKSLSDCIIISSSGCKWYTHKIILSFSSEYFKGLIEDFPEENEFVLDFSDNQINKFLLFIYKNEFKILKSEIVDVFIIADFLICKQLLLAFRKKFANDPSYGYHMTDYSKQLYEHTTNFHLKIISKIINYNSFAYVYSLFLINKFLHIDEKIIKSIHINKWKKIFFEMIEFNGWNSSPAFYMNFQIRLKIIGQEIIEYLKTIENSCFNHVAKYNPNDININTSGNGSTAVGHCALFTFQDVEKILTDPYWT